MNKIPSEILPSASELGEQSHTLRAVTIPLVVIVIIFNFSTKAKGSLGHAWLCQLGGAVHGVSRKHGAQPFSEQGFLQVGWKPNSRMAKRRLPVIAELIFVMKQHCIIQ